MIAKAPFGSTGHESTRTIFGAAALGSLSRPRPTRRSSCCSSTASTTSTPPRRTATRSCGSRRGCSQHRDRFFLATKTGQRDRAGAHEEIRRSLDRLGVDHVDLLQLHNLVDVIEWETALREGGALEAAVEARDEGLVRFIGVTGHGLTVARMHLRSLERFPFDSVLLPYSYVQMRDEHYAADFEALAARVRRARRRRPDDQGASRSRRGTAASRPPAPGTSRCSEQADIDLAVHWVLGRPGVFLNTVGDVTLLPKVLDAASRYESRPPDETMDELAANRNLVPLFS